MPKNTVRFIDFRALKSAVKMQQVLDHYRLTDQFKPGNDSLTGPCPIHKGTHATQFRVSISKNCWNCFSDCHCGGNVLDFVAKMEKVDTNEAANRMVEWFNLDIEKLNAESERAKHQPNPNHESANKQGAPTRPTSAIGAKPTGSKASEPKVSEPNKPLGFVLKLANQHPYFAERGLTPETVAEFGLGFCDKGVMSGRIAIPIHNMDSELVGYAGRWPGKPPEERPKYRLPDGFKKASEIYRLAQALREPEEYPLIIVEGFFDVMKLWQLGIRKTVALMGSSMSATQEQLIIRVTNENSTIIVMFDEDDAGRAGRDEVLRRLATKAFVRVVAFEKEDFQPEDLTAGQAQHILGGGS
jgi:DNA primase